MMYRYGTRLGRIYLAVDRGLDWRGWLCAIFRVSIAPWAVGSTFHVEAKVGPFLVNLKVL